MRDFKEECEDLIDDSKEDDKIKASLKIATDALIIIEVQTANKTNVLPFETINTKALKALRAIRDME